MCGWNGKRHDDGFSTYSVDWNCKVQSTMPCSFSVSSALDDDASSVLVDDDVDHCSII
jgi:hypothetical protein